MSRTTSNCRQAVRVLAAPRRRSRSRRTSSSASAAAAAMMVPSATWASLARCLLVRRGDWDRARSSYAHAHRAAMGRACNGSAPSPKRRRSPRSTACSRKARTCSSARLPHAFAPMATDWARDFFYGGLRVLRVARRRARDDRAHDPRRVSRCASRPHALRRRRAACVVCRRRRRDLAGAFDRRNGNDHHVRKVAAATDVLALRSAAA